MGPVRDLMRASADQAEVAMTMIAQVMLGSGRVIVPRVYGTRTPSTTTNAATPITSEPTIAVP